MLSPKLASLGIWIFPYLGVLHQVLNWAPKFGEVKQSLAHSVVFWRTSNRGFTTTDRWTDGRRSKGGLNSRREGRRRRCQDCGNGLGSRGEIYLISFHSSDATVYDCVYYQDIQRYPRQTLFPLWNGEIRIRPSSLSVDSTDRSSKMGKQWEKRLIPVEGKELTRKLFFFFILSFKGLSTPPSEYFLLV